MNQEGTSDPSDLVMLPIAFLIVLAVATAVYFLIRRFGPQPPPPPAPPEQAAHRPDVPDAVRTLREAGLNTDALLGPWLVAARGYDPADEL
jgi:hypothetical protein